jgi:hypothetical protein
MTAADRTGEFVNSDCALAKKGLAFPSKQSMYVDVRGPTVTDTLRPVDRIDPGLVLVRGRIGRAPRDEGSNHVHQIHRHAAPDA